MSWQMHVLAGFIRLTRHRRYATAENARAYLAEPKRPAQPPARLRERLSTRAVDGFPVHTVEPETVRGPGSTVYLHGGGYVGAIATQHWDLVADIATATGRPVHVPRYGLAPQHTARDAHALLATLLAELDGPIHLAGDSAGAGLALAAALNAAPTGLTLIAPWLDIALTNPEIPAIERRDPWLSAAGLRLCGEVWRGDLAPDDPLVSPLFGDLTELPPIDLYIGGRDIALADCRLLRDRAPAVAMHEEPGAIHDYPLLPFAPESRAARRTLLGNIAATFG
ncbi:alpha/beta hydrolase fold domain-containing protein [Nocardia asteroides]|uniref:alpha/beta hydrolase fold domain-containing protein n=1 Tax=Nocardia asteroides TaxID=1824 RepID=UPI001E447DAE|nr:alpha/beta hydrolase fold domain-containing protein [Nocardia asteroides]UGT60193.1 alpha/beta hydrolase [Nocardia asteroides]